MNKLSKRDKSIEFWRIAGTYNSVEEYMLEKHAQAQSIVDIIKNDQRLQGQIDSFFEHSGGTKSITSVLDFLRNNLRDVYVSYSDHELLDYLNSRKQYFKQDILEDRIDVGIVGTDPNEEQSDYAADYITHGKK